jgi:hypothetical protein
MPTIATTSPAQQELLSAREAYETGLEAYVYFYPLVMMDVTRRQLTNIEAGKMVGRGPMNTFTTFVPTPLRNFEK